MKTKLQALKLVAVFAIFFGSNFSANAQEFRLGASAALPAGDAADVATFNATVDASFYFININDKVSLGVTSGYSRFFGKTETVAGIDVEYDDFSFVPVAASGRALFGKSIFYTADIGYAIGLDDTDGGLFYQAKLGWTNSSMDIFLLYNGISAKEADITTLGLGVSFKL